MDLLDVGVTANDVLHAVQVLAALVDNEVRTVVRQGRRGFEGHTGTGEEVTDSHFFRTLTIASASPAGSGTAKGIRGRATRPSGGTRTTSAQAGHLEHGSGGERVDFGLKEAIAGILADFDDATRADGEAEANSLTDVIESLVD